MNLYFIFQEENSDYGTFDSAVVRATTEEEARQIHPSGYLKNAFSTSRSYDWASCPERVTVELIGTACPGAVSGVVCSSFNAS